MSKSANMQLKAEQERDVAELTAQYGIQRAILEAQRYSDNYLDRINKLKRVEANEFILGHFQRMSLYWLEVKIMLTEDAGGTWHS